MEFFDDLLSAVFQRLDASIKKNFEEQCVARLRRNEKSINPLLSCFVNDCLSRGVDIESGGAKYNWVMPSFVGVANLVDSLYAVKKAVFDNHELSLCRLRDALNSNFKDNETI